MLRTLTKTTAWFIYFGIIALYAFSLWALVNFQENSTLISFNDVIRILGYSFLQAILSASISLVLGCLLANIFFLFGI